MAFQPRYTYLLQYNTIIKISSCTPNKRTVQFATMKPKCFFLISRYNENPSWIKKYTNNYIIYNKGKDNLQNFKTKRMPNIGGNQYDIFHFIHENYGNLPDLMAFMQAEPFDHCPKKVFNRLIQRERFTSLEYYGPTPANKYEKRDFDGGFMEINNSWYIEAHNKSQRKKCRYSSLDEFMQKYFKNYQHVDWIRFAPGSQYIIEKKQARYYPKKFWKKMMDEISKFNTTEAHIIERSLWMFFQCTLQPRTS